MVMRGSRAPGFLELVDSGAWYNITPQFAMKTLSILLLLFY